MAYVVIHVAVSLDGATTGFTPDVARFYELAGTWQEDVTLAGADTILAQEEALAGLADPPGPAVDGPLLAVTDRRSRIPSWMWETLRSAGHWRDAVPVRDELSGFVRGLGDAVVRVDSGGALNGALLRAGLVQEISLLVHPVVVGAAPRWYGSPPPGPLSLARVDGGAPDWLRYRVHQVTTEP
jgi:2,5-diamino-6-(ribosylamino)-4(3H)-pyrimidinone 5'-phosphate reductase